MEVALNKVDKLKAKLKDQKLGSLAKKLRFHTATFDFGKKDKNPLDSVLFYSKAKPNTATHKKADEVSYFISHEVFKEQILWIISRDNDDKDKKKLTELQQISLKWCRCVKKANRMKLKKYKSQK